MSSNEKYIYIVVGILIGVLLSIIGYSIFATKRIEESSTISQGVTTQYVLITKHVKDTVILKGKDIHYYTKGDTIYKEINGKDTAILDSIKNCLHTEKTYADSSFISIDLCSRYFPAFTPPDLQTIFIKKNKPDSLIIKNTRDTLTLTKTQTKTNWPAIYIAGIAAFLGGFFAGLRI